MWFTLQSPSHHVFGIPWEYGTMVVFTADLLTQFHSVSKFPSPPPTHTTKINTGRKHEQNGEKKLSESRAPSHHSPLPWLRPFSLAFLGTAALASKWKLSCCVHICCTSKLRPCSTCGAPHRRGKTRAQRGGKGHIIARVVHTMTCGNVLIQCLGEVGVFGSVGHE